MSIATYLTALDRDRDALAANLTTKGVPASSSETFTTLVPKVLDIPSGGGGGEIEWDTSTETTITVPQNSTHSTIAAIGTGIKKLTVENMTLVAASEANATYWFIDLPKLEEITFKNCTFGKSASSHGIKVTNAATSSSGTLNKITIKNCILSDTSGSHYSPLLFGLTGSTPVDIIFDGLTIDSNRTTLQSMFAGAKVARSITGLNSMDVSGITNFSYCFNNCDAVTSLDLSTWNPTNATNVARMFQNCSSLATLDLSSFDFSHVASSSNRTNLFNGVPTNCTIYVKDAATQSLLTSWDSTHTYTIKT